MSKSPSSTDNVTEAEVMDETEMAEVQQDPVLQGKSALTDPDLGGSTAASWTGTGGPDPGGMVSPMDTGLQQGDGTTAQDGDQLQQAVSQAGDQMQQAVGQVVDQAQQTAGQVVEGVRMQATSRLSAGKDQLADTVDAVAQALRQSSQGLREQNQAMIAQYAEQGADRLQGTAQYLRDRDVQGIIDEVEDLARRQPTLFLGAAFGLGFLAARFLKSSRQQAGSAWNQQRSGALPAATTWQRDNANRQVAWGSNARDVVGAEEATTVARPGSVSGTALYRLEATLPGSPDISTTEDGSGATPRM